MPSLLGIIPCNFSQNIPFLTVLKSFAENSPIVPSQNSKHSLPQLIPNSIHSYSLLLPKSSSSNNYFSKNDDDILIKYSLRQIVSSEMVISSKSSQLWSSNDSFRYLASIIHKIKRSNVYYRIISSHFFLLSPCALNMLYATYKGEEVASNVTYSIQ